MGKGRCRAKAQGRRGGRSLSLPGEARIEPGAHQGGVRPRTSMRGLRRAMGQGSCRAKAQRHRRECSLSLPGEGRVGPGTHSGWVRPGFSLSCRRRARLHGRRRAEAERRRRGSSLSQPGKARVWQGAHLGGILQRLSLRAQNCMGVAGPKPSKAGVGSASPRPRAKPGSVQGREPTRVGSCPESACAGEGAPGCKGVAGSNPSVAGEGAASASWAIHFIAFRPRPRCSSCPALVPGVRCRPPPTGVPGGQGVLPGRVMPAKDRFEK